MITVVFFGNVCSFNNHQQIATGQKKISKYVNRIAKTRNDN